jgi:hypothetical protein
MPKRLRSIIIPAQGPSAGNDRFPSVSSVCSVGHPLQKRFESSIVNCRPRTLNVPGW